MDNKTKMGFVWFFAGCFLYAIYQHEFIFAGLLSVTVGTLLASEGVTKPKSLLVVMIPALIISLAGVLFVGFNVTKYLSHDTFNEEMDKNLSLAVTPPSVSFARDNETERDIDAKIQQIITMAKNYNQFEICLQEAAFGKGSSIQMRDGKKFSREVESFKVADIKDDKGHANFVLKTVYGSSSPVMKKESGVVSFSLVKLQPGEFRQDCMPEDSINKIVITGITYSN